MTDLLTYIHSTFPSLVAAAVSARADICITHSPGHMFICDTPENDVVEIDCPLLLNPDTHSQDNSGEAECENGDGGKPWCGDGGEGGSDETSTTIGRIEQLIQADPGTGRALSPCLSLKIIAS